MSTMANFPFFFYHLSFALCMYVAIYLYICLSMFVCVHPVSVHLSSPGDLVVKILHSYCQAMAVSTNLSDLNIA